jgi:hypothetical protein
MTKQIRWFLFVEAAAFGLAALVHSGVLVHGHEHGRAATAETVIGLVLLVGLGVTMAAPRSVRAVGIASQAFALLGTLVGIVMIAIGVGPRSVLDAVFHIGFVTVLVVGLVRAWRGDVRAVRQQA